MNQIFRDVVKSLCNKIIVKVQVDKSIDCLSGAMYFRRVLSDFGKKKLTFYLRWSLFKMKVILAYL